MAFKYHGNIAIVERLTELVNQANARGELLNVGVCWIGGARINIFSTENQLLNIKSGSANQEPQLVDKWMTASPKSPPKPNNGKGLGKASFKSRAASGEIITAPHEVFRFEHTLVFIPRPSSTKVVRSQDFTGDFALVSFRMGKNTTNLWEGYGVTAVTNPDRDNPWAPRFVYDVVDKRILDFVPSDITFIEEGNLSRHRYVATNPELWYGAGGLVFTSYRNNFRTRNDKHRFDRSRITLEVSDVIVERPSASVPSYDFFKSCQIEQPKLIIDCIQRLDQAELDLLTSVAEMGQSVRGLADNVARTTQWILDMLRHARKGRLVRLVEGVVNTPVDVGSRKNYNRRVKRYKRDLERYQAHLKRKYGHEPKDSVDRLTSHWLDAQYGILPSILTVQDTLATLSRARPEYERRIVSSTSEFSVPEDLQSFKLVRNSSKLRQNVWGKMKFDPKDLSLFNSLRSYGKINPALTAWELVPLSFVADWFINIGDILSTISVSPQMDKVFMTSWKLDLDATYEFETPSGTYVYVVRGSGYKRSYTDLSSRFIPQFNFDLSWQNHLTAFSLVWKRVRGHKIPKGIANG